MFSNYFKVALRNIPFAIPALLLLLPAGPIFATVVGVPVALLEALNAVTNWRREGDLVRLIGPKTLRFRVPTN